MIPGNPDLKTFQKLYNESKQKGFIMNDNSLTKIRSELQDAHKRCEDYKAKVLQLKKSYIRVFSERYPERVPYTIQEDNTCKVDPNIPVDLSFRDKQLMHKNDKNNKYNVTVNEVPKFNQKQPKKEIIQKPITIPQDNTTCAPYQVCKDVQVLQPKTNGEAARVRKVVKEDVPFKETVIKGQAYCEVNENGFEITCTTDNNFNQQPSHVGKVIHGILQGLSGRTISLNKSPMMKIKPSNFQQNEYDSHQKIIEITSHAYPNLENQDAKTHNGKYRENENTNNKKPCTIPEYDSHMATSQPIYNNQNMRKHNHTNHNNAEPAKAHVYNNDSEQVYYHQDEYYRRKPIGGQHHHQYDGYDYHGTYRHFAKNNPNLYKGKATCNDCYEQANMYGDAYNKSPLICYKNQKQQKIIKRPTVEQQQYHQRMKQYYQHHSTKSHLTELENSCCPYHKKKLNEIATRKVIQPTKIPRSILVNSTKRLQTMSKREDLLKYLRDANILEHPKNGKSENDQEELEKALTNLCNPNVIKKLSDHIRDPDVVSSIIEQLISITQDEIRKIEGKLKKDNSERKAPVNQRSKRKICSCFIEYFDESEYETDVWRGGHVKEIYLNDSMDDDTKSEMYICYEDERG